MLFLEDVIITEVLFFLILQKKAGKSKHRLMNIITHLIVYPRRC